MAVPALPSTYLILIEPAFAFGRLEAGFDFPSAARDVDQGLPFGLAARRVHDVIRMLALLIQAALRQQVMPEAALFGGDLQAPQGVSAQSYRRSPFAPAPAERRRHARAGKASAIRSART